MRALVFLLKLLLKIVMVPVIPLSLSHSQKARIRAKRKSGGRRGEETPFLPPQMGYLSRLRKFGELCQYLFNSVP